MRISTNFTEVRLEIFQGADIAALAADIARISNVVFKEYPYLYGIEDDADFYIAKYSYSQEAKLCLAYDDIRVVGYIIGEPLKDYSPSFQQPFIDHKLDINNFFYIGEGGVLPEYRGQCIGKNMLLRIEELVKQDQSYSEICFACIDENHISVEPPIGYRSLAHLWSKAGYERREDLSFNIDYTNINDAYSSTHTLIYWTKCFYNKSK